MVPRQPALEIHRIRRTDGTVGGELDGRALHKRASCHHDLGIIPRHCPGDRGHVAVDRSCRLNALAERQHPFGTSQLDCLNDVVARLRAVRHHAEAQLFIHVCRENCALERAGDDRWREEEALIEAGKQA